MVTENLKIVHDNIAAACARASRDPSEVTLAAVSKTKPPALILEAYNAGERIFGENKVQEILEKKPVLPADIKWHMIGHLQRNKVRAVIGEAAMIHSLDSWRLAEAIQQEAERLGIVMPVLIEVNVAGEESKFGMAPAEVPDFVRDACSLSNLRIQGLMTIAPYVEDPEENRPVFRALKKLSVDIGRKNHNNVTMNVLSMGMSNDYAVAVEEGATIVRIGSRIFGER